MNLTLTVLSVILLAATTAPVGGPAPAAADAQGSDGPASTQAGRFVTVDVYIDSQAKPLAAYQFELTAAGGDAQIVGVEGGEHPAFNSAPYYDPAALSKNRIIIAAFSTGNELPSGKSRVARMHLLCPTGQTPQFTIKLQTSASADGTTIPAMASIGEGETR
jgi:hypothetical protein